MSYKTNHISHSGGAETDSNFTFTWEGSHMKDSDSETILLQANMKHEAYSSFLCPTALTLAVGPAILMGDVTPRLARWELWGDITPFRAHHPRAKKRGRSYKQQRCYQSYKSTST